MDYSEGGGAVPLRTATEFHVFMFFIHVFKMFLLKFKNVIFLHFLFAS